MFARAELVHILNQAKTTQNRYILTSSLWVICTGSVSSNVFFISFDEIVFTSNSVLWVIEMVIRTGSLNSTVAVSFNEIVFMFTEGY